MLKNRKNAISVPTLEMTLLSPRNSKILPREFLPHSYAGLELTVPLPHFQTAAISMVHHHVQPFQININILFWRLQWHTLLALDTL